MPRRRAAPGLLVLVVACTAGAQTLPSGGGATGASQQRFRDLVAVVEGQNTVQARRTATIELLRQGWPEAPRRLATILTSGAKPARLAVTLALSESREFLDESLVEPLIGVLRDDDPELRTAAAAALAAFGDSATISRLETLLVDEKQPAAARTAAIDALGRMTAQQAVAVLMNAVSRPEFPFRRAALSAIERATAQGFGGDFAAAEAWWRENGGVSSPVWMELQISRLVRQNDATSRRMRDLEVRLAGVARESYLRATEGDRPALLAAYLADTSDVVRLAGLELLQTQLTDGKPVSDEIAARARALIDSPEDIVRAAAIRTVTSLRSPADAPRFLQMLSTETSREVRVALIYALGYVGDASVIGTLVPILSWPESAAVDEAVTALGRLAERPGVLDADSREIVARALLNRYAQPGDLPLASRRELLRAMTRLADGRFRPIFLEALDTAAPKELRLQALRGIAAIIPPAENGAAAASTSAPAITRSAAADVLAPLVADADLPLRRLAIETLGPLAQSDAHFQALISRLSSAQEPDESVRQAAWKSFSAALLARRWTDAAAQIDRLPVDLPDRSQRTLELLSEFEKSRSSATANRAELGGIRTRLAAQRALAGQIPEAIQAATAAIDDLLAAKSPDVARAAAELLRIALLNDRYDDATAALLAPARTGVGVQTLWEAVRSEVEPRLRGEARARAIETLKFFREKPPAPLPDAIAKDITALIDSASAVKTP